METQDRASTEPAGGPRTVYIFDYRRQFESFADHHVVHLDGGMELPLGAEAILCHWNNTCTGPKVNRCKVRQLLGDALHSNTLDRRLVVIFFAGDQSTPMQLLRMGNREVPKFSRDELARRLETGGMQSLVEKCSAGSGAVEGPSVDRARFPVHCRL